MEKVSHEVNGFIYSQDPQFDLRCLQCARSDGDAPVMGNARVLTFHIRKVLVAVCRQHRIFTVIGDDISDKWERESQRIWTTRLRMLAGYEGVMIHDVRSANLPPEVSLALEGVSAEFCDFCWSHVSKVSRCSCCKNKVCGSCHSEAPDGSIVCHDCGSKIWGPPDTSSPDDPFEPPF